MRRASAFTSRGVLERFGIGRRVAASGALDQRVAATSLAPGGISGQPSDSLQEIGGLDFNRPGDPDEGADPSDAAAVLKQADLAAVDLRSDRKLFLGEAGATAGHEQVAADLPRDRHGSSSRSRWAMGLVGRTAVPWCSSNPALINSKTALVNAPRCPISLASSGIVRQWG
jgi:hypothetical protein